MKKKNENKVFPTNCYFCCVFGNIRPHSHRCYTEWIINSIYFAILLHKLNVNQIRVHFTITKRKKKILPLPGIRVHFTITKRKKNLPLPGLEPGIFGVPSRDSTTEIRSHS